MSAGLMDKSTRVLAAAEDDGGGDVGDTGDFFC